MVFIEPDGGVNRIERVSPAEGAARFLATVPPTVDSADWTAMSDAAILIAADVTIWVLRGWDNAQERVDILERLIMGNGAI